MREFNGYMAAINKIVELETGEKQEESLTGKTGAALASKMFRRKKK